MSDGLETAWREFLEYHPGEARTRPEVAAAFSVGYAKAEAHALEEIARLGEALRWAEFRAGEAPAPPPVTEPPPEPLFSPAEVEALRAMIGYFAQCIEIPGGERARMYNAAVTAARRASTGSPRPRSASPTDAS